MSLIRGDARQIPLRDGVVQTVVTSPPYWGLRDYGDANQIGLEPTPEAYVASLVAVFREVRRVLRDDGTVWCNLGDCYAGSWGAQSREHAGKHAPNISALSANQVKAAQKRTATGSLARTPGAKNKDLLGIPWRVAFALQSDGWYLRSDIIWAKPNPMPESVTDRPTRSHEYVFLLTKQARYYYDAEAIKEPLALSTITDSRQRNEHYEPRRVRNYGGRTDGYTTATGVLKASGDSRNRRSVWTINPQPYSGAHFATFPEKLVEPCILAGSRAGDLVCDPFIGSGTVGVVATRLMRRWVGVDLSYQSLSRERTRQRGFALLQGTA
jgi:site-specific DNA-methyltransferase (cytosine-N4-specific)